MSFVVRTDGDATAILPAIRRTVADIDRDLAVNAPGTLRDRLRRSLDRERYSMLLLGLFAAMWVLSFAYLALRWAIS